MFNKFIFTTVMLFLALGQSVLSQGPVKIPCGYLSHIADDPLTRRAQMTGSAVAQPTASYESFRRANGSDHESTLRQLQGAGFALPPSGKGPMNIHAVGVIVQ
ncbi:hypothetical protein B0H13DRAFT_2348071 [Mycena leptocephala]|nr:hypothetical protein B0H13DRAFT_2348071 [Mycena leptocephala]